jgi:hypothetical protein
MNILDIFYAASSRNMSRLVSYFLEFQLRKIEANIFQIFILLPAVFVALFETDEGFKNDDTVWSSKRL